MERLTTIPQAMLKECDGCTEYSDCYYEECGEIEKAIERLKEYEDAEQAKNFNDGWILVKDKMPDEVGRYLTCDEKGNIHIFFSSPTNIHPFCIPENHSRYYQPIAWRPLPEPWKGDKK